MDQQGLATTMSLFMDSDPMKMSETQELLLRTASRLETSRSLRAEHEASLLFALSLLSNNVTEGGSSAGLSSEAAQSLPASVRDAWLALVRNADWSATTSSSSSIEAMDESVNRSQASSSIKMEYSLPSTRGQLIKALFSGALFSSLERAAEAAHAVQQVEKDQALSTIEALRAVALSQEQQEEVQEQSAPTWIMQAFYHRVAEIQEYHAKHVPITSSSHTSLLSEPLKGPLFPVDTVTTTDMTQHPPPPFKKTKRVSNPMADGFDLHSIVDTYLQKIQSGDFYSSDEVFGKYFDFQAIYQNLVLSSDLSSLFLSVIHRGKQDSVKLSYLDFLHFLLEPNCMTSIAEDQKLLHRKKYIRFLYAMKEYLIGFLHRVTPLLDIETDVLDPAVSDFIQEWSKKGGIVPGWELKPAEAVWASTLVATHSLHLKTGSPLEMKKESTAVGLDLSQFSSVDDLIQTVDADALKVELSRLGLKCGGTLLERAKRLWLTRDTPLNKIPSKHFVKPPSMSTNSSDVSVVLNMDTMHIDHKDPINQTQSPVTMDATFHVPTSFLQNSRRIDIAYLDIVVMALIDQARPTLDATARRAERRLTQTVSERERELMDEILGTYAPSDKSRDKRGDEDEDEEEEEPIYNPKGVPLGWDGKPIPYWLFKLHGLNHFYPCEICGNESYRGRRNFEKHFTETKHAYGMRCLGIPNTNHFHGVTRIEDAQALWAKLQQSVSKDKFDGSKEEEYEDSHGNVLSRSQYEDLARQGLL